MSIFRRAMDQLVDRFWAGRKVALHLTADHRIARRTAPLIKRLLADDEDGETCRNAIATWSNSERPPLAVYQGAVSSCRIDGPLQWAGDYPVPLGGLVLSPGVTAQLNPFEASDLRDHMRDAIERAILAWLADNGHLYDAPVTIEIDRPIADREAKAMIAEWVARNEANRSAADPVVEGPDHV